MKNISINNKEYKIQNFFDEITLSTHHLGNDLAIVATSKILKKVALGRDLDNNKLVEFFQTMNPNMIKELGLFQIKIIGGSEKDESVTNFNQLMQTLESIDAGRDIINIKTLDVCGKIHPDSFQVDCYHGGITAIQN